MKAAVNGVEINYEVSGNEDKPWVTFSNSLATNLHMWDEQAQALGSDFHVLRYDKRGHGQSEAIVGPYSFNDLMGDIVGLMDDFERVADNDAEADAQKLLSGQFNLKDFYKQITMNNSFW